MSREDKIKAINDFLKIGLGNKNVGHLLLLYMLFVGFPTDLDKLSNEEIDEMYEELEKIKDKK